MTADNFFIHAKKTFRDEISSINHSLNNLSKEDFNLICNHIKKLKGKLVLMGVGKSGHIAAKISSTLSSTGTPSFFINPSEASHGDLGAISKNDGILIISNSGETDEIVLILSGLIKKTKNILFYHSFISSVIFFCIFNETITFNFSNIQNYFMITITALIAQYFNTESYKGKPTNKVMILSYSRIIFSTALGFFLMNENLSFSNILGVIIIILTSFLIKKKN